MLTARQVAESILSKSAGAVARVAGGQEFGPAAAAGVEHAVDTGEHLIRKAVKKLRDRAKENQPQPKTAYVS